MTTCCPIRDLLQPPAAVFLLLPFEITTCYHDLNMLFVEKEHVVYHDVSANKNKSFILSGRCGNTTQVGIIAIIMYYRRLYKYILII